MDYTDCINSVYNTYVLNLADSLNRQYAISKNIQHASRWSIDRAYYEQEVNNSNIGIFLTYNAINADIEAVSAFILAHKCYDSNVLNITLLASAEQEIKLGLGLYLIALVINNYCNEHTRIYIHNVTKVMSYYEHNGFKYDINGGTFIPAMQLGDLLNEIHKKLHSYVPHIIQYLAISNNRETLLYSP
jgi:hypothetical protein